MFDGDAFAVGWVTDGNWRTDHLIAHGSQDVSAKDLASFFGDDVGVCFWGRVTDAVDVHVSFGRWWGIHLRGSLMCSVKINHISN